MLLTLLCLSASLAGAGEITDTLARIKETGQVIVGHRESSVPFSYYDNNQNVIGYSQDYSNLIVEALKKELGLPNLKVKLIPITSQNRIPLLQNGTYDFECGSTTNNLERQKQVAFSNTLFIIGTRLLVHKDSGIKDFPDLKGKTLAVTSGTTSERLAFQMKDEKKLDVNIISLTDHVDSFRAVESGRADAFFIDDALLAGERAKSRNPGDWIIVGTPQSFEAYGCMLRKGDPKFKAFVDKVIADAQTSGKALESFKKWFQNPIPPRGMNMNFEVPDALEKLFANPNDKAFQ
ncbi:MAG: glutamate/aspartate ABC transporter substrate-binding protein [Planctomycetota bacterium]|nr:glutamate/aspartate ABC transporter substrate-binding protein [Planctomycetota bacterium]MDR1520136.1 glutamate/aspartate ABC transporter substrate-binding protein [Planctomycetota bacterium]